MSSSAFTSLVSQVVEAARGGTLLSEALYQEILGQAPPCWDESEPETLARAIRQLAACCDWSDFHRARERLDAGANIDDLHLEVKLMKEQREALMFGSEFQKAREQVRKRSAEIREDQHRFLKDMRGVEILMGFDQGVTDKLVATLGCWESSAVPETLLDLLPREITFPLRRAQHDGPYDHRLHRLVGELVCRLGEEGRSDEAVIKHCGHVLADLLHADDLRAGSRLALDQATLLAEDYTRRNPWEVIGLCWRGELAWLDGDDDLATEFAERVWKETANASAKGVNEVTSFFALTTGCAEEWGLRNWDCPDLFARSHLGEIKSNWLDDEQPLALAIVRRAFRQGTWDTSLLRSTIALEENEFSPEPEDLPADCWVWLAEHIEHAISGDEIYYEYWCHAYEALADDTNPELVVRQI